MPRLLRSLLSVLLLVTLPVLASAGTVLIVGDSISAGYGMSPDKAWPKLLQDRITQKGMPHKVHNGSLSGDTSAGGLSRLSQLLRQTRPGIVIIELGGNDGLRGIGVNVTRKNLTDMANMAKKAGAKVVLLGMDLPPSQGPKYVKEFRESYATVARNTGATLVPGFLAKVGADPDLMQSDGIHPNFMAQPIMLDTVWPTLEPMLKAMP